MPPIRPAPALLGAICALGLGGAAPAVGAADGHDDPAPGEMCRVLDVQMTPGDDLQIVVWLEDAAGGYVDTLFLTQATGRRGLGNRPGRMDFNSAWRWPYGRRVNTFPVWAHRHGMTWPLLVFQNVDDDNLSHPFNESSVEAFYCRPLRPGEVAWDTQTCASTVYTDKGVMSTTLDSRYPPRADLTYQAGIDHPSVQMFDDVNPFDAVSQATPVGGARFDLTWSLPADLPMGDYVVWVEVSREFDHNGSYNPTTYPSPSGILWSEYGLAYRGQPSVLYRVPLTVSEELFVGTAAAYVGYGDPDGLDGNVRPPDSSIDTTVPGSGAQRLLTTIDGGDEFRVRVRARLEFDDVAPGAPADGRVVDAGATRATVAFVEPGDDGLIGRVDGYEVRYRAGSPITEDNFLQSSPAAASITPEGAGTTQLVTVEGLLPQTTYWIGVRAYDDCKNDGPLAVIEVTTTERETGEVDACFVATAAWGSRMADDVEMLRHVRDGLLRTNVAGELLVEAYYTFGPALAGLVGESEELRALARDLLEPLVGTVRGWSYRDLAGD